MKFHPFINDVIFSPSCLVMFTLVPYYCIGTFQKNKLTGYSSLLFSNFKNKLTEIQNGADNFWNDQPVNREHLHTTSYLWVKFLSSFHPFITLRKIVLALFAVVQIPPIFSFLTELYHWLLVIESLKKTLSFKSLKLDHGAI